MFIKKVIYVGDSKIDDMIVDVIISDGKYECLAMYDLPELAQDNILTEPLYALSNDCLKISEKEIGFNKLSNYYTYKIVGILHRKEKNIVSVGDILIELDDNIPKDIKSNTLIEFNCDRLDVIM